MIEIIKLIDCHLKAYDCYVLVEYEKEDKFKILEIGENTLLDKNMIGQYVYLNKEYWDNFKVHNNNNTHKTGYKFLVIDDYIQKQEVK